MKIAIRLDDITPDMDWERFLKFKTLLDNYQVKPLIGVVPDNRDDNLKGSQKGAPEDFWKYIKGLQAEGWCIAMHGYQHTYTTSKGGMFPLNDFSEFAGVPYEKQLMMLMEGKEILAQKGILTDIFMAPAHSYDKNTLRALKEAGFLKLTDGFGKCPYTMKGLSFYPISFRLGSTLRKKNGCSTMVVHTGTIRENEWQTYEGYFRNEKVSWMNYTDYLAIKPTNRGICGRTKEYFLAIAKSMLVKIKSL